ncbi:hypothetical protein LCM20_15635 [Halobacillus litoralis]|uniref:hypothetical protein n=1 Tax=Halobacillus litoralis TaxID=45668 RepID=UPI001CD65612|nr:hypothetical protein [Halobacillus litoralis]MCA0972038.1 hypothetical protein [Halobacillus litoralis]
MSFVQVKTSEVVGKQFLYKLKSYGGVFTSLVVIQLLGVFFSLSGSSSHGTGGLGFSFNIRTYSADIIMAFTIFWGFMTALLLTTKAYREDDFAFVTNRLTSNLSTISFLVTAGIIASLTACLSSFLIQVAAYIQGSEVHMLFNKEDMLASLGYAAAYTGFSILLFNSIGYLAGMIIQLNRLFLFILPTVFIGSLIILGVNDGGNPVAVLVQFIYFEPVFWLFILKTLVLSVLFFALAALVSRRLEVGR